MRGGTALFDHFPVLPEMPAGARLLLLVALWLMLSACGSGTPGASSSLSTASIGGFSDMDVARALYFDQRVPRDFYQESYASDSYTTVSHVRNTDLLLPYQRSGVSAYELSSDDFAEALAWSEQAATGQAGYRELVDSSETFLYHQFTRVDPASPQLVTLSRVFKAGVLDRSGVGGDYLGRITLAQVSAAQVKRIIEYLWRFTDANNYGNAVLASSVTKSEQGFEVLMREARLNSVYDGGCDLIEVYDTRYRVAADSGFIRRTSTLVKAISARRSGAVPEICSG